MDIQPTPDTKDWTWVLARPCPECGFDAGAPQVHELAALTDEVTRRWVVAFTAMEEPRRRPAPAVWSPLEYACHVRDLLALATFRVGLMLAEDAPHFANWDQDATAIEDDYASQDPAIVTRELAEAGAAFASTVASVPDDAWGRTGLRGDGAAFTIESFTRYLLHDPIHHLWDVTGVPWSSSP